MDQLNKLPIDIFIKQITYLPFEDVVSLCRSNSKFHNYCVDDRYNLQWKTLIRNTFYFLDNYEEKLHNIQTDLDYDKNQYNYLVYTQFVKYLDPITQLMIYYKQGDYVSFNNKFDNKQRFLALFMLGEKEQMEKYLSDKRYKPFINILKGLKQPEYILNRLLILMAKAGSLKGIKYLENLGANIRGQNDEAFRGASEHGHLDVVKYLVVNGANIHSQDEKALRYASLNGHLDVVKYLVEKGANIHAFDDSALIWASRYGHLDVVKYLVEQGADIHAENDEALRLASEHGHLAVVEYLKSLP